MGYGGSVPAAARHWGNTMRGCAPGLRIASAKIDAARGTGDSGLAGFDTSTAIDAFSDAWVGLTQDLAEALIDAGEELSRPATWRQPVTGISGSGGASATGGR